MYHSDYKILVHLLRNLVCCHANQFVIMSFEVTPCNLYYCFYFTLLNIYLFIFSSLSTIDLSR